MSVLDHPPPDLSSEQAERLAGDLYGIWGEARPLDSERDQNFHIREPSGRAYVLKIANPAEDRGVLDLQNRAMQHLADQPEPILVPHLRRTSTGNEIGRATTNGGAPVMVRLLTFVPGEFLHEVHPRDPALLRSVGRLLGRVDHAFREFAHPAARRAWEWDVANTGFIREGKVHIESPEGRAIVEYFLAEFEQHVAPRARDLRSGVIHNDGNDHNVIVRDSAGGGKEAAGIIDFGDMVHTFIVCELAIGVAYPILGEPDPVAAASHVVRGFHEVFPLRPEEIEVLYHLVCMRLCATVTMAAYRKKLFRDNPYLEVTEGPAWDFLRRMTRIDPESFHAAFRAACS